MSHRRMALAALLLGVAACGAPAELPDPAPGRAATRLTDAEIDALAHVLRHEDRRDYDDARFRSLLDGAGPEVRRRLTTAAGRIGDAAARPFLLERLRTDLSPAVRADAAFALGELGDASDEVVRALEAAAPSGWIPVREGQAALAEEALAALGKLATDDAAAVVLRALQEAGQGESQRAHRVVAAALLALWRFQDPPGRTRAVARFLDHPEPGLRWRAAWSLMRAGTADAVPELLAVMDDPDHRVRANAARALAASRADSAGVADSAHAALRTALDDPHPHVRINAVRALASHGADSLAGPIARLLDDPDPNVVVAAAGALADIGDAGAPPLERLARAGDRPLALRGAALEQLARADPEAAAALVAGWAGGGPDRARWHAARALASLGGAPESAAPLRSLASDADRRISVAALTSAASLAADSGALAPAAREALRRAAEAGDARVAEVARRGLDDEADSGPGDAEPRELAFYRDIVRRHVAGPLAGEPRPRAIIETASGRVEIELLAEEAPLTVHNFVELARAGFFDEGLWHRVVPNFVLQDGAPAGDPSGGPGWAIRDEINRARYGRGVLGMALSGPDTGGSQWFITHSPQPHLDGGYTVFGRVVDGMDRADAVIQGDPIRRITIR